MSERAVVTVLSLMKCASCGQGFRHEYYEDRLWLINFGEVSEHAQNVYSLTHKDCKEEA